MDRLYVTDDVSYVVVLLEANPYFWGGRTSNGSSSTASDGFTFDRFLEHVFLFINSILLLNQANQVVVIATGATSCAYLFDSSESDVSDTARNRVSTTKQSTVEKITQKLEDFMSKEAVYDLNQGMEDNRYSLLSESLSMALCHIQRVLRGPSPRPQPRILCLQGSPDASPQYIAVMNAIFSAQRSQVPIDACVVGSAHSAFLQQATHITGGIYLKPPWLDGLFEYLSMVFATDLYSRKFLQLPRASGVDFRASCFVTRNQLTWDLYAPCAYLFSARDSAHAQLVGLPFTQVLKGKKDRQVHEGQARLFCKTQIIWSQNDLVKRLRFDQWCFACTFLIPSGCMTEAML